MARSSSACLGDENSIAVGRICRPNCKLHLHGIDEQLHKVLRSELFDTLRAELDLTILKCHGWIGISPEELRPCNLKAAKIEVTGFHLNGHLLRLLRLGRYIVVLDVYALRRIHVVRFFESGPARIDSDKTFQNATVDHAQLRKD